MLETLCSVLIILLAVVGVTYMLFREVTGRSACACNGSTRTPDAAPECGGCRRASSAPEMNPTFVELTIEETRV
jgi:hypothetical protein